MKQLTVKEITDNPQSVMISTTWCPPCIQLKKAHKGSDFPYINYDELFEDGEFKTLAKGQDNLEVKHWLNTIGIKVTHFPTILEYVDGKYRLWSGKAYRDIFYKDLIEDATLV